MRSPLGVVVVMPFLLFCASAAGAVAGRAAPAPSCAAGPVREGDEVLGTPCADRIVVPPAVEYVDGGGGDDVIVATPVAAATPPCEGTCLGVRSPVYEGGPGDDVVFGERGNDTIRGNGGNDRLFGGIGDDLLQGGEGDDFLSGGFGADSIDGQSGSDFVRGDGTVDRIFDTGGAGVDTLSYATGVTPGFKGAGPGVAGFPDEEGERGVSLNLSSSHGKNNGNNGAAADGGGADEVEVGAFERLIGSPFADHIVGGEGEETIYGGGGADLIEGKGGDDRLFGGAGGDDLDGGEGADTADGGPGSNRCQSIATATACPENATRAVAPRPGTEVSVGMMAPGSGLPAEVYVVGSVAADQITAGYASGTVTIALSGAGFDTESDESGCEVQGATAICSVGDLDSLDLAGLAGADTLDAAGIPQQAALVATGGEGVDQLTGGDGSEDVLVDGRGAGVKDVLSGGGRDDALLHSGGPDELFGGEGNDLFLSTSVCDGETIDGEEGIDNASWARLEDAIEQGEHRGVDVQMASGTVGRFGNPSCAGGAGDHLVGIEDLEGSNGADRMLGDAGPNQLLGHAGPDEYFGGAGADILLANSEDSDPVIDCGADIDSAVIDIPTATYADATPVECESVREGKPDEFETATQLPPPPLAVHPTSAPDRRRPRTRITRRPSHLVFIPRRRHRGRVVFRFTSNERGSSFRCKLDRRPYRPCASPRSYTVGLGRHSVRIFAIDAAGNADRSPALSRFRVRRRGRGR